MIRRTLLLVLAAFLFCGDAHCEKALVAVAKGNDVEKCVRKAVDVLGGMSKRVKQWDRIAIKVSLDEAAPAESGMVTNVEVVRALVKMCKEAGARRVTIVEGSLRANTWKAFEAAGYTKMAREEGVQLKDLNSDEIWRAWLPEGDNGYKKYSVASTILNSEVFINVPVMKVSDEAASPSLASKNMLGIICDKWFKRRLPKGDKLDELIVDMNLIKQSDLVVVDGTVYGKMVIAGNDNVSADTVACRFMRLNSEKIGYLKLEAQKGLGQNNMSEIDVKTENI